MINSMSKVPAPINETVLSYGPGSPERVKLREALNSMAKEQRDLPLVIGGKEVRTKKTLEVRAPHKHSERLATLHQGDASHVQRAVDAALEAREMWASMSYDDRAAIFLKAAELLSGRYRYQLNAATMLGQSKTAHQAEIDSACELIDFLRFNVHFGKEILADQPVSSKGLWNRVDYRPLDGFVLAVTPFNFTAIAGNLPTAPALMGNTVLWKPATTSALSSQWVMDLLMEAGLPPGVINMVHAPGKEIGAHVLGHRNLAGVHFTGSTQTFRSMWSTIGQNIESYASYPRIVGETGGKDFIFAHASADVEALAVAVVRGGFEYQGQKCSAASRIYVPQSMWKELSSRLEAHVAALKMGDVADFSNFMGAVIDGRSFEKIKGYIDHAKQGSGNQIITGGSCDDSEGYFVQPTLVKVEDPKHKLMCEEIFGPVVAVHCYPDNKVDEALELCDQTSPYALTGAVFARDRRFLNHAAQKLRFAAGNFYINDKPTGAVVGQQPFGGARASGTNDKAGSALNLLRWASPRTVKETFDAPRAVGYPYMEPDR